MAPNTSVTIYLQDEIKEMGDQMVAEDMRKSFSNLVQYLIYQEYLRRQHPIIVGSNMTNPQSKHLGPFEVEVR